MSISIDTKDEPKKSSMEVLEEALIICKFGKFHVRLLAASMFASFAAMITATTSSYILPVAECDLDMNIMQKGILNAMPFFGQVGASLFSGFLLDVFGRRIFLVGSNAAIFILTIIEGSSQVYWMLLVMKVLQGIALSLCWGAMSPMLTEFIHKNVRDRVLLLHASFISMSLIAIALVSWGILPLNIEIVLWKGYFELHAWNIYLYANSIWSFIATLLYLSIPESPKYLLSHGQEKKALEVLKTVYSENTGNERATFPILFLNSNEVTSTPVKCTLKQQLTNAMIEVKTLFRTPLLQRLLLFTFISFIGLLTYTPLRLWYPQVSTIIENYQYDHKDTARFCAMINTYKRDPQKIAMINNVTESEICIPQLSGSQTYTNGILMGCIFLSLLLISGFLVKYLGQKILMFFSLLTCTVCSASLYWTYSSLQIALLISTTCALMQTFMSLQQNLLVRVFPTTLRALTISIIIMMGRIGSLLGNILFPILMEMGCMAPFLSLSVATSCMAGLVFFLPNTNGNDSGSGDR